MRRPGDGNEAHPLLFYPLYLRRKRLTSERIPAEQQ